MISPQRRGMVVKLLDDQVAAYCDLHDNCWPEVRAALSAAQIRRYTIYLRRPENTLFGHWEYHGSDWAAEGAQVFATDVNAAALEELAALGLNTLRLDICDPASIADAVAAVPAPDVVFNCAGFVASGTILDCDEDQWAQSINLNLTAMYRMCRAFLPGLAVR